MKSSRIPISEQQFSGSDTAGFYDEHARRFMGTIYRRFAKKAAGITSAGNRVLDIGTGSGLLPIALCQARPEWRITGIDISEEMLKLARENTIKACLSEKIECFQASGAVLPFPDSSFDIVVSNASLHLWENPVEIFNEIGRVMMQGGLFLLRDNRRVGLFTPFLKIIGAGMGMSKEQRRLWLKAVQSAYTSKEAGDLLKQSVMKDAKVKALFPTMELEILWRKW